MATPKEMSANYHQQHKRIQKNLSNYVLESVKRALEGVAHNVALYFKKLENGANNASNISKVITSL